MQDKMNLSPYPSVAPPQFHPGDIRYNVMLDFNLTTQQIPFQA